MPVVLIYRDTDEVDSMSPLPQKPHSANSSWLCWVWFCVQSSVLATKTVLPGLRPASCSATDKHQVRRGTRGVL